MSVFFAAGISGRSSSPEEIEAFRRFHHVNARPTHPLYEPCVSHYLRAGSLCAGLSFPVYSQGTRDRGPARMPPPARQQPALELPEVPGLRLLRSLGRGAQGAVYLARTEDAPAQEVAVKVLAGDSCIATWRRLQALRPQDSNGRLIEAYDCGALPDGGSYISMAYLPRGSLKELLKARGALPESEALALASQLCEALALLHSARIIHRDVKPSNVLLRSEDQVCLADFGLTRGTSSLVSVAGTPGFCAPELFDGVLPNGEREQIDLYALAATLHAMLTCRAPRPGVADVFALERQGVSRPTQALLVEALARDPRRRPRSARAFSEALAACAEPPADPGPAPVLAVSTDWIETAASVGQPVPERDPVPWSYAPSERYVLREEIGRGGMGVVFRALDQTLRREVAVKVIAQRLGDRPEVLSRFVREAQATGQLQHPGIVPIYDIAKDPGGRVFFAMKLVQGRTLAEVFRDAQRGQGPTLFRLLEIFVDIVRSVAFAHGRGVIHRDLKPGNVMIGDFGEVQVMDWGLAKLFSEPCGPQWVSHAPAEDGLTQGGSLLGTPAYMAPEQAADSRAATASSDIFSLGSILYELLVGEALFEGCSRAQILSQLRTGSPPLPDRFPRGVARELQAVCRKALARAPEERYATAEELAEDVQAHIEGRPVRAAPQGIFGRLSKAARRNPRTSLTFMVLLGLLSIISLGGFGALSAALGDRNEALRGYRSLSDLKRLAMLDAWESGARQDPDSLGLWIGLADELCSRLPGYREDLERLSEQQGSDADQDSWLRARLYELVGRTEALAVGRLETQRSRLAVQQAYAPAWAEAISAVAESSSIYRGLRLRRTADLVPLGRDPHSGLWEFGHLLSGTPARRDAEGVLRVEEATGLVFVLIPPGSFSMGSEGFLASIREKPVHRVRLDGFFLSKYELTQGQWLRLSGSQPSAHATEAGYSLDYPLESVLWSDLDTGLRAAGLRLPTEAQWEYAARAGTTSDFWTGDDEASIVGRENLAREGATIAKVGCFDPNPWGLYDVMGNVAEWCEDQHVSYEHAPINGRGERPADAEPYGLRRVCRGANYRIYPMGARSASRGNLPPGIPSGDVFGCRPTRLLAGRP